MIKKKKVEFFSQKGVITEYITFDKTGTKDNYKPFLGFFLHWLIFFEAANTKMFLE